MIAIKEQDVEKIKSKEIELFSTKNIFNNDIRQLLGDYKKFYKNVNVLSFLKDSELVETALSFFEYNLNISIASKSNFMHRNTLVYRIEKIKKLLGLDIRIYSEAVLLENLIIFYKNIIG